MRFILISRNEHENEHETSSPLTSVCLSVGEDLARTRSLGQTLSIRSCSTWTHTTRNKRKGCVWFRVKKLSLFHSAVNSDGSYSTSPFSLRILLLNSLPSMQRKSSPGWMIPHLMAMALAVFMLSPVTMRTVIPARWHFWIASGTWRVIYKYVSIKCAVCVSVKGVDKFMAWGRNHLENT